MSNNNPYTLRDITDSMKIYLTNANLNDLGIIDINTIEDLIKLYHDKDEDLIFSKRFEDGSKILDAPPLPDYQIMVYDRYIE